MRSYILSLLLFSCFSVYSQTSINNYKYVLVPENFSFLKQNDQYGLNTMTKSLLEENGFTAYFDNATLPTELANNKCNTFSADVTEKKSIFTTKLTLLLKDCKGNVVFKGKEGISREKEFGLSYTEALKDAFTFLKAAKYVYQPLPATNDQQLTPAAASNSAPAATPTKAASSTTLTAPSPNAAMASSPTTATPTLPAAGSLYAQPIANGYQLIDTTPRTILRMFKTSTVDYFIADNGSSNGIVFKRDENWFFEYYKDGKLLSEKLLIKF